MSSDKKPELVINTVLGMLIGQDKATVRLVVTTQADGVSVGINAKGLDMTVKAKKVFIEIDGNDVEVTAGRFTVDYNEGALSAFKPEAEPVAEKRAPRSTSNRGSGSLTNPRLDRPAD